VAPPESVEPIIETDQATGEPVTINPMESIA